MVTGLWTGSYMGKTDPKDAGKKPLEKILLKDERVLFWGYLAEKCTRCGIHQPFEVYPFEPSFFENEPIDMMAQSVRTLAYMGACPIYEPQLNPGAHYLHVCTFCGQHELSESPPEIPANVYWEPVDRFRVLAEATASDRSCFDEKRHVSFSAASRFFRSIRHDTRFQSMRNLAPLGIILLVVVILASAYLASEVMSIPTGESVSPHIFGMVFAGVVIGALLIGFWIKQWRRRYCLVSLLMLHLYPFSLELPTLLKHARKVSHSKSIAKALKPLVNALDEKEETEEATT